MQTFVLAPQTPNKYYVHNDIFRYQDEVFNDSDEEEELEQPHSQHITPQKPNVAPTHIQPGQSLAAPALLYREPIGSVMILIKVHGIHQLCVHT